MNEVNHAGHAYSSVGRTTVKYTVSRSSTRLPDRLSCSSRQPIAYFSCYFINMYVPCQVAGDSNVKYLRIRYSLSVYSVYTHGCEVYSCFREPNNKLFCITFVDVHIILDFRQVRCIGCDPLY